MACCPNVEIHLRECNFDTLLVEAVVYGLVEFMDGVQADVHAGNIAAENEVELNGLLRAQPLRVFSTSVQYRGQAGMACNFNVDFIEHCHHTFERGSRNSGGVLPDLHR